MTSITTANAPHPQTQPKTDAQGDIDGPLNVAKPNKFTGTVRVSYVDFEEGETGGYKKSVASKPPFEVPSPEKAGNGTPTLIFSTWKDSRGKWTRTEIKIKSTKLLAFLKDYLYNILIHDGLLPVWRDETVTLTADQVASWASYEKLREISEGVVPPQDIPNIDKETTDELKCLIDHVEQFEAARSKCVDRPKN